MTCLVWFMVLTATFINISVISWRSVLLVEESRVPGENHRPVANHWWTLSHNVVSSWRVVQKKIHTASFSQMKLNFCVHKWSFQLKLSPLFKWAQFSLALFGSVGDQLVNVKGDKSETHSHFPFTWRAPIHRSAREFLAKIQNKIHMIYTTFVK